jgi:ferredoxin
MSVGHRVSEIALSFLLPDSSPSTADVASPSIHHFPTPSLWHPLMATHRHLRRLTSSPLSLLVIATVCLSVAACAPTRPDNAIRLAQIDQGLLQTLPEETISFTADVRPVLERRCVVCHGCYDAPCQLKLSSPEGIGRGASKEKVYDGARFMTMSPTRLYIDANTTREWREKGFHSVLNEGTTSAENNLNQSVMYKMLHLKEQNPQARSGRLSDEFDLALDRTQTCPTADEFDAYAARFPDQGMPFAMPNLSDEEFRTLVHWLAQGAPMPDPKPPSPPAARQIDRWERFLNGTGNKQRLVARYLYEHLFLAHIHFNGSGDREFYRLVRSRTGPGQPIDEIPTVRPYDDPGPVSYYRLRRYPGDIVAKTHLVYPLSDKRMARFRRLFLVPDYEVTELPGWDPAIAANPFKAFKAIPPRSRYEFLLDDARYFIDGFIKGPVCRGMIALNVIEDRFWVVFVDPDRDSTLDRPEFLERMSNYLEIPSAQGERVSLLGAWNDYRVLQQRYADERFKQFAAMGKLDVTDAMDFLWDGDGENPNAALTVFRHFDSASVDFGFVGDYPETAWVIDFPLLERIHYLLVAGFNVFGNLGHQLNTRLYMDFLRMEGEDTFLSFLPTSHRKAIRDGWYQGMRAGMEMEIGETDAWMAKDVVTGYVTSDPQREFYQHMERKLAKVLGNSDTINRCDQPPCHAKGAGADKRRADEAMHRIAATRGGVLAAFPDVTFIRVTRNRKPANDLAYTVIRNKAYKNVTSMFQDEEDSETRDYSKDSLTVVDWLEGSYPNFFFVVDVDEIDRFADDYVSLKTEDDFERLVSRYGTRRTNPGFWSTADWFHDAYRRDQPIQAGLFDLNRYQNW